MLTLNSPISRCGFPKHLYKWFTRVVTILLEHLLGCRHLTMPRERVVNIADTLSTLNDVMSPTGSPAWKGNSSTLYRGSCWSWSLQTRSPIYLPGSICPHLWCQCLGEWRVKSKWKWTVFIKNKNNLAEALRFFLQLWIVFMCTIYFYLWPLFLYLFVNSHRSKHLAYILSILLSIARSIAQNWCSVSICCLLG